MNSNGSKSSKSSSMSPTSESLSDAAWSPEAAVCSAGAAFAEAPSEAPVRPPPLTTASFSSPSADPVR